MKIPAASIRENLTLLSKIFLIICISFKIIFSVFAYLDPVTNELKFSGSFKKLINNDENDLASRSYNLIHGKGFVKTIVNHDTLTYKLSSNRPLLNIAIHYLYQKIYVHFYPLSETDIIGPNNKLDKTIPYYVMYSKALNYIALLFFLISIPYFFHLLKSLGIKNKTIQNFTTGAYLVFPSTLIYIGCVPLYENICLPISIIGISFLLKLLSGESKNTFFTFLGCSFMLTISMMLRPQVLTPTVFTLMAFGIFVIIKTKKEGFKANKYIWKFIAIFSVVFIMLQSCVFIVNYKYFKQIFYTNRGDAFMWGHYDLAKGSWDGTVDLKGTVGYNYERKIIPGYDDMTEIEQNNAQNKIGKEWIKNNLDKEIKLTFKKLAILFMPYNFENLVFNFPMFIIHIGLFLFLIFFIFNFNTLRKNPAVVFILVWIFGIVFVNLMFFVEYRVKYFADPYMLILTAFLINYLFEKYTAKQLNNTYNKP